MSELTEEKIQKLMNVVKILNEESKKNIAINIPTRDKKQKGKTKQNIILVKKKKRF